MHNQADPLTSCVFCKIVQGRLPRTLIEEWESAMCIVPLNPCASGHVIYISKKHVKNGQEHPETTQNTIGCAMQHPHKNMTPFRRCNIL
jgi:diadenosine tetraphosphate (Ap4A) HIT family hydrolase